MVNVLRRIYPAFYIKLKSSICPGTWTLFIYNYKFLSDMLCQFFVSICCSCWKLYRSTQLCTIINIRRLFMKNQHHAIAQEKWGDYGNSYRIKNQPQNQCNKFKQPKSQLQLCQVRILFVFLFSRISNLNLLKETGLRKEWKWILIYRNTCVNPA